MKRIKTQCFFMILPSVGSFKNQISKKNGVSSTRNDNFSGQLVWQSDPICESQTNHNRSAWKQKAVRFSTPIRNRFSSGLGPLGTISRPTLNTKGPEDPNTQDHELRTMEAHSHKYLCPNKMDAPIYIYISAGLLGGHQAVRSSFCRFEF